VRSLSLSFCATSLLTSVDSEILKVLGYSSLLTCTDVVIIIIVIDSPMDIFVAFFAHFSFIRMITGIGNVTNLSTSMANFQSYHGMC
ncbi:MAG: hypothetical protein ACJ707_06905, partial [Nitrososphaera sp.]